MKARFVPKMPNGNVNVSSGSRLKELVVLLGGVMFFIVAGYYLLGLAVDVVAPHISYETERRIAALSGRIPLLKKSTNAPSNLQVLANRVRKTSTDVPFDAEVYILPSKQLNAFALPGARIVVTTGLLESLGSENELAFVLGHEYGHIANRDHLKGMGRGLIAALIASFVFDSQAPGDIVSKLMTFTELSFSREQEIAADEAGQDALAQLYGHVAGAENFFRRIAGNKVGYFARFALTHPRTQERIKHLEERAVQKGWRTDAPLMPMPDAGAIAPQV